MSNRQKVSVDLAKKCVLSNRRQLLVSYKDASKSERIKAFVDPSVRACGYPLPQRVVFVTHFMLATNNTKILTSSDSFQHLQSKATNSIHGILR